MSIPNGHGRSPVSTGAGLSSSRGVLGRAATDSVITGPRRRRRGRIRTDRGIKFGSEAVATALLSTAIKPMTLPPSQPVPRGEIELAFQALANLLLARTSHS